MRRLLTWPLLFGLLAGCDVPHATLPMGISRDHVPVVWGFGGTNRKAIVLPPEQWLVIESIFDPPAADGEAERQQIATAVAQLERFAGEQTPIRNDVGLNRVPDDPVGQCDCVAESHNSTSFLCLLEQEGLLRHHDVRPRVFRAPKLIDGHYSGCVRDRATGVEYVIDTWFEKNGELPRVQEVSAWKRAKPLD